ncbi:hypothetical protein AJ79_07767 [Helicocarpus griseus UAMH5409]|uniref:Mid2 domain-containing protein n=1 Tax=Helicocarpus griseus UAMH5409 TaxID=1447875 RepID=A0A2B7WYQ1_9EURO|nr:hypothetical protein AJ79_07767 [Helicocarpus griseus UAMH5409]
MPLTPQDALGVLRRDTEACSFEGRSRCKDPNAPPNFCCPSKTYCITLDNSSSVLCCRDGENCQTVWPMECNIEFYDPVKNPRYNVATTNLDQTLQKCGKEGKCCPPGYACHSFTDKIHDTFCMVVNRQQASPTFEPYTPIYGEIIGYPKAPKTTNKPDAQESSKTSKKPDSPETSPTEATPHTTIASSFTTTTDQASSILSVSGSSKFVRPTPEITASPSSSQPQPSLTTTHEASFPLRAVLAGLFPGLIVGVLIALVAVCLHRRRQANHHSAPSPVAKFGHFREKSFEKGVISISDPIPSAAQDSVRTDFLRHQGGGLTKEEDSKSKFRRTSARMRSFFGPRPTAEDVANMPTMSHHHGGGGREPSTESIKVFSPAHLGPGQIGLAPGMVNGRPQTTFSEMMERVGFQSKTGSPFFSVTTTPPLPQLRNEPRRG